jgi:GTP pyrophosphokinase
VSIHRADCPNLLTLVHEPERRLDIDWQEMQGERFTVRLTLEGYDRRGLYADVAGRGHGTGPTSATWSCARTTGARSGSVVVEVENLAHLQRIIRAARKVRGITEVARRERLGGEE